MSMVRMHCLSCIFYSVLQSDSASVRVPELDLELASGTLGGIVTTVEGLIAKISGSKFSLAPFKLHVVLSKGTLKVFISYSIFLWKPFTV